MRVCLSIARLRASGLNVWGKELFGFVCVIFVNATKDHVMKSIAGMGSIHRLDVNFSTKYVGMSFDRKATRIVFFGS